jgi:hypothetical protein
MDISVLIGQTEEEAKKIIDESFDLTWRMVSRDGQYFAVTRDLRTDRVNLEVENGIVTGARLG